MKRTKQEMELTSSGKLFQSPPITKERNHRNIFVENPIDRIEVNSENDQSISDPASDQGTENIISNEQAQKIYNELLKQSQEELPNP